MASTATAGQLLLRLGVDRKRFPGSRRYLFSKSLFSATSSKLVFILQMGSPAPERQSICPGTSPQRHLTRAA